MMLTGYKTYIAAAVIALATAAKFLGWVSEEVFQSILGALTALGLVASRVGSVKEK